MPQTCYDLPRFYDISYTSGMGRETRFLNAILARHFGDRPLRILEPACGTGRVLLPLIEAGHDCAGFDINPAALAYLRDRLRRRALQAQLLEADMADFSIRGARFDAAVCTVDTFRHLLSEEQALAHLACVAKHLRRGGLYLLAMQLLPPGGYSEQISRWRDVRGDLRLHTTISVLGIDRRRREERLSIVYTAESARALEKHRFTYSLRTYTVRQFLNLLSKAPGLELAEAYEYYAFDVLRRVRLGADTEDVMLVLRRS
jgi:SAM-dependent methyltransferase